MVIHTDTHYGLSQIKIGCETYIIYIAEKKKFDGEELTKVLLVLNKTRPTKMASHITTNSLEEGRPTSTVSSYKEDSSVSASELCCCCCGGTLSSLIMLAIRVSSACFAVSGAVFWAEEYSHIPDCASSYKGWIPAMTVIYGLHALQGGKNKKDSSSGLTNTSDSTFNKAMGVALAIVAIFPGLIAGLGHRDVLEVSNRCDISGITRSETWSWWIVIYNMVLCILLLLASIVCCICG